MTGPMTGVWVSKDAGRTWEQTMKYDEWTLFDPEDFKKPEDEVYEMTGTQPPNPTD
jgi:hypothetical protein